MKLCPRGSSTNSSEPCIGK